MGELQQWHEADRLRNAEVTDYLAADRERHRLDVDGDAFDPRLQRPYRTFGGQRAVRLAAAVAGHPRIVPAV